VWRQRGDIGPLAGLTQLEELDLSECPSLCDLTPLKSLTNLRSLKVTLGAGSDKPRSYDLEPLSHLTRLTTLHLSGRLDQYDYSFLANLRHLTELDIHGRGEAILSHLGNLAGLRKLFIASSTPVLSLEPLSQLTSLTDLSLVGGWGVSEEELGTRTIDLSPLTHLVNLVTLSLPHQLTPTDLSFLRGLEQLEQLVLGNCMQLADFSPLAHLPRLSSLTVRGYQREECRLGGLPALTSLSLADIRAETLVLTDFPRLHTLHLERGGTASSIAIHSLNIERAPLLPKLELSTWTLRQLSCTDLPALASLTINEAMHLHTLMLHQVPQLMRVNLYQADRLRRIQVTGETRLKILSLSTILHTAHLSSLPHFEGLTSLEKLWIWAHYPVPDLSPLQQLPQLRELALYGLQDIEDLTPLTTLIHLEDLLLSGCSTRATHLAHLPALTRLSLAAFIPQEPFTLEDLPRLRELSISYTHQGL
jgi:hypothetical protein